MDATMDDIPKDFIQRFEESEFQITYDGHCYSIVDTSIPMTIADEFIALADALVFLKDKAKLI